jgi:hypothetical protein
MKMASDLEAISKVAIPHQGQNNSQPGLNLNQVNQGRAAHSIKPTLPFWHFEANPQ